MTGTDGERSGGDDRPADDQPFDPYRFGRPDTPPAPEYAPPGYVPDPASSDATGSNPAHQNPGYRGLPQWGPPPGPPPDAPPPYPPHYGPFGGQHGRGQNGPPTLAGRNGRATTSLVLGIASILLCWLTIVDFVPVVLAFVFGAMGLRDARSRGGAGRGAAIGGMICAAVGLVLTVVFLVVADHLQKKCGGIPTGSSAFRSCAERNF